MDPKPGSSIGWSIVLCAKSVWVQFLIRARTQVAGLIPGPSLSLKSIKTHPPMSIKKQFKEVGSAGGHSLICGVCMCWGALREGLHSKVTFKYRPEGSRALAL